MYPNLSREFAIGQPPSAAAAAAPPSAPPLFRALMSNTTGVPLSTSSVVESEGGDVSVSYGICSNARRGYDSTVPSMTSTVQAKTFAEYIRQMEESEIVDPRQSKGDYSMSQSTVYGNATRYAIRGVDLLAASEVPYLNRMRKTAAKGSCYILRIAGLCQQDMNQLCDNPDILKKPLRFIVTRRCYYHTSQLTDVAANQEPTHSVAFLQGVEKVQVGQQQQQQQYSALGTNHVASYRDEGRVLYVLIFANPEYNRSSSSGGCNAELPAPLVLEKLVWNNSSFHRWLNIPIDVVEKMKKEAKQKSLIRHTYQLGETVELFADGGEQRVSLIRTPNLNLAAILCHLRTVGNVDRMLLLHHPLTKDFMSLNTIKAMVELHASCRGIRPELFGFLEVDGKAPGTTIESQTGELNSALMSLAGQEATTFQDKRAVVNSLSAANAKDRELVSNLSATALSHLATTKNEFAFYLTGERLINSNLQFYILTDYMRNKLKIALADTTEKLGGVLCTPPLTSFMSDELVKHAVCNVPFVDVNLRKAIYVLLTTDDETKDGRESEDASMSSAFKEYAMLGQDVIRSMTSPSQTDVGLLLKLGLLLSCTGDSSNSPLIPESAGDGEVLGDISEDEFNRNDDDDDEDGANSFNEHEGEHQHQQRVEVTSLSSRLFTKAPKLFKRQQQQQPPMSTNTSSKRGSTDNLLASSTERLEQQQQQKSSQSSTQHHLPQHIFVVTVDRDHINMMDEEALNNSGYGTLKGKRFALPGMYSHPWMGYDVGSDSSSVNKLHEEFIESGEQDSSTTTTQKKDPNSIGSGGGSSSSSSEGDAPEPPKSRVPKTASTSTPETSQIFSITKKTMIKTIWDSGSETDNTPPIYKTVLASILTAGNHYQIKKTRLANNTATDLLNGIKTFSPHVNFVSVYSKSTLSKEEFKKIKTMARDAQLVRRGVKFVVVVSSLGEHMRKKVGVEFTEIPMDVQPCNANLALRAWNRMEDAGCVIPLIVLLVMIFCHIQRRKTSGIDMVPVGCTDCPSNAALPIISNALLATSVYENVMKRWIHHYAFKISENAEKEMNLLRSLNLKRLKGNVDAKSGELYHHMNFI